MHQKHERKVNRKHLIGGLLLLLTAFLWGMAFVAQREGADFLDAASFNSLRFLIAGIVLLPACFFPFLFKRRRKDIDSRIMPKNGPITSKGGHEDKIQKHSAIFSKSVLKAGALGGLIMCIGINLQQWGLMHTTATKGGFITGLYVVFVAFMGIFFKQKITKNIWFSAGLALVGLFLLTGADSLDNIKKGDVIILFSAVLWAFHVQYLGWVSLRYKALPFATVQAFACALFSFFILIYVTLIGTVSWPHLDMVYKALPTLLYTGVISTAVAFTIQIVAQSMVPPTTAAITMSLESVFSMFGGWLILHEIPTKLMLLGAGLMLCAIILAEIKIESPKRVSKKKKQ